MVQHRTRTAFDFFLGKGDTKEFKAITLLLVENNKLDADLTSSKKTKHHDDSLRSNLPRKDCVG